MINRVLVIPQNLPPLPGENLGLPAPVGFPGMPQASPVVVQEFAVPESGSTEWLGGLFRRKQEEKVASAGGDRKSEMLESFDTPSAPIPTFEYK